MYKHTDLGTLTFAQNRTLKNLITSGAVTLAGNKNLKIYGRLQCKSGKRMNLENRVFFGSEIEAVKLGYRPCGHCMTKEYKKWKDELV